MTVQEIIDTIKALSEVVKVNSIEGHQNDTAKAANEKIKHLINKL